MSKSFLNSIEQLIETVKEYPILYNKIGSVPGSVNNEEKNQVWNIIAKKINEDPNKLKQKWRNLRDSYQKAIKNKREMEEITKIIGQPTRYHPYRHEERMSFLLPHILNDAAGVRKKRSTKIYDENFKFHDKYVAIVAHFLYHNVIKINL